MAYTEFYTQSGGSNLNAGSTTTAAVYTSVHGNWVNATAVFTPTDGINPSLTVSVGMWGSVYIDGASVGVYVARITTVTNAVNGAITVNTNPLGAKPANQTGTATLVVGGPWLGPNGASGFPFTLANFDQQQDASGHMMRVNMKNDQTYSLTAAIAFTSATIGGVVQGYTSSAGDGGKATWDGGTSTGALISDLGGSGITIIDHIFTTSITTGTSDLVTSAARNGCSFIRCVFQHARQKGLAASGQGIFVKECEAYDCNLANTAATGAFHSTQTANFLRCFAHDNTGSNTSGFFLSSAGSTASMFNCVSETNGAHGVFVGGSGTAGQATIANCDFYNNTGDGINVVTADIRNLWFENNNLFKNAKGINNVSVIGSGYAYNNTYGAGTQANTGADVVNNLTVSGSVTYTSNLTPWVDPANGNFSQQPNQGVIGRGAFTETAANYAGTTGFPFTGASPAQITPELRIPSIASI